MKAFFTILVLCNSAFAQEKLEMLRDKDLYQLARTNLKSFAEEISKDAVSELEKAQRVVKWLAEHLEWKATDYKQRTAGEVIERGGGNCSELTTVAVACFKELGIRMRRVREINIHKQDSSRGERARQLVKEKGNRYSVFGRHHNDHVWLEIYDSKTNEWYPADPSIGIVGTNEWLEARAGFGERYTLDPISEDMIVPFAIFAEDLNGKFALNRTQHYMVDGFNMLYKGKLQGLRTWKRWVELLDVLDEKAEGAFNGQVNLHDYQEQIDSLGVIYGILRSSITK